MINPNEPTQSKSYATTLSSLANRTLLMMQADVIQNSIQPRSLAQRQHPIHNNRPIALGPLTLFLLKTHLDFPLTKRHRTRAAGNRM